ncbi:hypothetical protein CVIRNUC_009699 [Coccomyxa viridis]|uniref:Uncharacterized protein n=1 Tax=Coccomyxa viridis TaxID=1274662 RepID=A0AAV1IIL1_9CHLO|nr:hypothetical protein CVIRNUC_009699 [Coccomyxa viridis]
MGDMDLLDVDDMHPTSPQKGCSSKVVLLEFAAVRRGSQADLACEEAPEASMHLEPLPTPRRSLSDAMRDCSFIDASMQPSNTVSVDASPSPRGKLNASCLTPAQAFTHTGKRCMHPVLFLNPHRLLLNK